MFCSNITGSGPLNKLDYLVKLHNDLNEGGGGDIGGGGGTEVFRVSNSYG